MIKLKEGQKVIGEDGDVYLIEKGDILKESITENSTFSGYEVLLIGGGIGERRPKSVKQLKGLPFNETNTSMLFLDYTEALVKAKRMNKLLSPGEKKYYGLKWVIAEIADGVYTGV